MVIPDSETVVSEAGTIVSESKTAILGAETLVFVLCTHEVVQRRANSYKLPHLAERRYTTLKNR